MTVASRSLWPCLIRHTLHYIAYTLPSKRALKEMVVQRYEEEKTKAKAVMQRVEAVSLTADMWTSINMDAYLAVTCYYVDDSVKLATVLLGVLPVPKAHTAVNITAAMRSLMREWGLNCDRCRS
ncbi:putative AC9 transposase [Dissostichus eleginoides]|uniref:AC9 transposase n=1 Tax=Dissostichus eleginoides TaxID=100907 RepID=A0AAD9F6N4_DISEL|nr:putative AC9 transposase [Dissostichus eleginoides]